MCHDLAISIIIAQFLVVGSLLNKDSKSYSVASFNRDRPDRKHFRTQKEAGDDIHV